MVINLSQQDIVDLKQRGYSEGEISKAVGEIEKEELQGGAVKTDPRSKSQTSAFKTQNMNDIARYQLELNDLLEQTEHILKGDVVTWEKGVSIWSPNPHPEDNPLNSEGIRKVMLELQTYINRHVILGDYEENDINRIMRGYGKKVANLLFMKYEEMGMDTEVKRQEYASLVLNIVNLVYASYSRAKNGGERRSLREMISQQYTNTSQAGMGGGVVVNPQQQRQRGVLNPMRYIGGKYV